MLCSLSLTSSSSSYPPAKSLKPHHLSPSPHPSRYIKFRTAHHENLRYLKAIGVIDPNNKPRQFHAPDAISHILATLKFLESKGFLETDFARLTFLCPELLSLNFDITDIEPCVPILDRRFTCFCSRIQGPTLNYLRQLGVAKLNVPSNLNAHLLNIRVEQMQARFEFLRSIGFSHDEAANICGRLPAIFGYSIENNLRPKVEYLVDEMKRSLDELKEFPQYFAFSLEKKIMPRHLHLKRRNAKIKLNRMLLWSDGRFYAKWK
ncbi:TRANSCRIPTION TERMINATION FACTOR MTEF1 CHLOROPLASTIC [Salix koriyanagi]|uniref:TRANSCRIPTION TERMINATION FACTOR MTEF1 CHLOROPLASTIC n=1 Tax=Salix koriyanagi TaxID=2511006 RepID=A0A9Q0ZLP6_9ROSI|nr:TRANSCRIPTION TERMINATION FACTOR MTEF1 CHLOROPLASTIC [Salix koriyanagi]